MQPYTFTRSLRARPHWNPNTGQSDNVGSDCCSSHQPACRTASQAFAVYNGMLGSFLMLELFPSLIFGHSSTLVRGGGAP